MNYVQLAYYFLGYYNRLLREKAFIKKNVLPLINQYCKKTGYHFSLAEQKKVLVYYPLFTLLGVAENYLLLRNRKLKNTERLRLILVSIMAALFDDLIDEEHWQEEDLLHLLHNRLTQINLTPKAKLILALNEELHAQYPPSNDYRSALEKGIHWQVASKKQLNENITLEEVLLISRKKNGYTSFMFAYLLDQEWLETEIEIFYQTGILGQLVNDAYDLFKDIQEGIYTSIRKCITVEYGEHLLIQEWKQLVELLNKNSLNKKQQIKIKNRLCCIYGFGLVAFEQFKKSSPDGSISMLEKATRKQLVIDMELWPTRLKLLRAIIQMSKMH